MVAIRRPKLIYVHDPNTQQFHLRAIVRDHAKLPLMQRYFGVYGSTTDGFDDVHAALTEINQQQPTHRVITLDEYAGNSFEGN